MQFIIVLLIAKKHLLAKIKQTLIAALGVTFGIGMFISMVSFMTGVNKMLDDLMLSSTPHIRLFNDIKTERTMVIDKAPEYQGGFNIVRHVKPKDTKKQLRNSLQIIRMLEADKRIIGVAPRVTSQVFYQFGASDINGTIVGVDIQEEDKLFDLSEKMIEGELLNLLTINNGVIVGKGLSNNLAVGIDDRINIVTSKGVQFQLIVVGIYQTGIAQIDDVQSYTSLNTAQKILEKNSDYITDINLKVTNLKMAGSMSTEYERRFEVDAIDYDTANAQIKLSYDIRNTITYAVSITLLLVAGFGIYNILNMFIYEKMDDIAILKATGFTGKDVRRIFISQALIIGIAGGVLGLIIGYVISLGISTVPFENDALPSMKTMPVNFDPKFYIIGITFALATTFLAGYLPANKASIIDPVEIIRGK